MKKISLNYVKKNLPTRSKVSSKIDGGKVLIIGGSKGLFGAGILAALAATKSGAGYTYLMTDIKEYPWMNFPDFIVHSFSLAKLKEHKASVIGIGPGLGLKDSRKKLLVFLLKNKFEKVVVDGDALTLLSKMSLKKIPSSWILTPHEGELARLLDTTSADVKLNRYHSIKLAQKKYGCVVVLKGAETLIADSNEISLIDAGTTALAKAGSGDVLLGLISALYAQNLTPLQSAQVGCFIHGYTSRIWLKEKNDHLSMRPGDLIERLPKALFKIRK